MTTGDGLKRSPWYTVNGYQARTVTLSDGHRTTELQHRVIMEAHIGRKLAKWEHDGTTGDIDLQALLDEVGS